MNAENSSEIKSKIVQEQLDMVVNSIYSESIRARVAKNIDDAGTLKAVQESLVKLEKMKDELEKILGEFKQGT